MNRADGGGVVWITGLPGAGKTTLARALHAAVRHRWAAAWLDGEAMRAIAGDALGYTTEDRLTNAYRLLRLSKHLAGQGLLVICSTVSLFAEIHEAVRRETPRHLVVYLDVPMGTLMRRDQKALYSRAAAGTAVNVRGFDQPYDVPRDPDYTIRNDGDLEALLRHEARLVAVIRARWGWT